MDTYDFDLFVIGAGSGGVRSARMAASYGARVGICEERYIGGTCVNVGCVPKKLLVYGAGFSDDFEDAKGFGWEGEPRTFHWETLRKNKDTELKRLDGIYRRMLNNANVDILWGRGTVLDAHTVKLTSKPPRVFGGDPALSQEVLDQPVTERIITAKHILIATGSWPHVLPIPGAELGLDSNKIFDLPTWPKRVLIIGAGYIGLEFAGVFGGTGSTVDLIYRSDHVLRGFDKDVQVAVEEGLVARGILLHPNDTPASIKETSSGARLVTLGSGKEIEVDLVFFATGRTPMTQGIGLKEVGVELDSRQRIVTNERFESTVPSILALGDVANSYNLTPVATAEGMRLVKSLFGEGFTPMDYHNIPTAVFSNPEVACVGRSEAGARRHGHDVVVYRSTFRPMKNTLSGRGERIMMKLVVDRETDKVLGCHMVGPHAGETIQGFAVALQCGATKAQFDATIGIHPTAAEEFVTMRTPVKD